MARVLVLGGYGLIGSSVARRLDGAGHSVKLLGRNRATALRVFPDGDWTICDLASLQDASDWREYLQDIDAVVNCSGALQASAFDDLECIHHLMVGALAQACDNASIGLVQISAVGATKDAGTLFLASKARGDAAIQAAAPRHWIFRPGLVIGEGGYGGTQLLRMLAAVPLIQPVALGETQIQTVSVHDLAHAVLRAVEGNIAQGDYDVVEAAPHRLRDVIASYRRWLGTPRPLLVVNLPPIVTRISARIADGLGRLGWRSPLRSTALGVLRDGVTGKPAPDTLGKIATLDQTLSAMPARYEDKIAARMALLMPLVIAVLSAFWLISGVVGVFSLGQAAQVLVQEGWSELTARAAVLFWSVVDVALGCMILYRPWAKRATLLMVLVSVIYLVCATLLTPYLWLDPLGPLVKTVPAIMLALLGRALLDTR